MNEQEVCDTWNTYHDCIDRTGSWDLALALNVRLVREVTDEKLIGGLYDDALWLESLVSRNTQTNVRRGA